MMSFIKKREQNFENNLVKYLLSYHKSDLDNIVANITNNDFKFLIDVINLLDILPKIFPFIFENFDQCIELFKSCIKTCINLGIKSKEISTNHINIDVCFINLPLCQDITQIRFPLTQDLGKFLCIKGTVIRTWTVKMIDCIRWFECQRCLKSFKIYLDVEKSIISNVSSMCKPAKCVDIQCNSKKFKLTTADNPNDNKICGTSMSNRPDTMKADDYQEIKIQERTQSSTSTGKKLSRSRTCKVVLRGSSLVDSCKVGDDVTINGVLRLRYYFDPRAATESGIEMETVFVANHVTVDNEISNEFTHSLTYAPLQMKNVIGGLQLPDQAENEFIHFWKMNSDTPFKARDSLLSGICPHIFGAYAIKLALALVLAGGIEINSNYAKEKDCHNQSDRDDAHVNVNRIRGRCHCLLIGDEGTGKSQFLKFASKILPRSIYTNALNVSHAGLTVTAVRSSECSPRDSLSGGWALEAGLLVLTDGGGALCLESIDSLKGSDLTALHETMEQQTISVAKAGIVCKLSSKSSIIASITPAQRYESNQTLTNSLAISKALLSRFDLVFLLKDRCFDVSWDTSVANHVLNGYLTPSNTSEACEAWSLEKVQNYFLYIKNARPVVTQQSQSLLSKYYCFHRKRENDTKLNSFGSSRSTIRMLESLIRLSQAHAKLMLHQRVEIEDAISVIALMEYSLQSTLKDTNPYNLSDANDGNYLIPFHYFDAFPSDADDHYKNIKDIILSKI